MSTAKQVQTELKKLRNPEKAAFFPSFFKAGPGEYGEGDKFLGVTVPNQRLVAKQHKNLVFSELQILLNSEYHEHRLTALIILTLQYPKASEKQKQNIYDFYLYNAKKGRVNNWDLVDTSAHKIVGQHLLKRDRSEIQQLADSGHLWEERIAVIACAIFIANHDFTDIIRLSEQFLTHKHDLIHKATGWMLREAGKRDEQVLREFLNKHAHQMPRTMLRYSIERLPKNVRQKYMVQKK